MNKGLKRRNSYKSWHYVELMHYKCANPDCKSGTSLEGHHIIPLSYNGPDEYWNLISLCKRCHAKYKHRSDRDKIELFTWKCMQELQFYGFNLDEKDEDFPSKLKQMGVEAQLE